MANAEFVQMSARIHIEAPKEPELIVDFFMVKFDGMPCWIGKGAGDEDWRGGPVMLVSDLNLNHGGVVHCRESVLEDR